MSRVKTSQLCIICILASFISTPSHAYSFSFSSGNTKVSVKDNQITTNRPWGNLVPPKPATMYQPLPPPASYYQGAVPDNGWYTAALPGNGTAAAGMPSVEVEVQGSNFYEQQNIIYTVRVVSDGNIKTLKPEMPRIEGAALEQLDGPVVSTRTGGRDYKRQIINSYRFKLMPLRSGEITIPAIRFTGTHAQNRQLNRGPGMPAAPASSFNIVANKTLTLQVHPADSAVNPWLPLHDLKLQTNLQQQGPARAGEPVTLVVELNARGALGNQLPSLERQLESKHYRIYRDATAIKNGFSARGDYLTGNRKETYTIIPLEDGLIRLPEVSVAWWDVDTHTAMLAGSPFGHAGTGSARNRAAASSGEQSMFPVYFWAPLIITLSLIAGFWLGSWHRTRPLIKSATAWSIALGRLALQQGRRVGTRLSPAGHLPRLQVGLNRVRMSFALLMPRSIKLWMCTRCLDAEDNPDTWCTEFKSRVCQHLNISEHAPLTQIAEKIIMVSPQAEPTKVRALAHSLDGAIYGGSSLDFIAWKRELVHQMRPHLLRRRRSPRRMKAMLPALNPRLA